MRRNLLTLFVVLLLGTLAVPARAERRTALIIGNGAYKDFPLKNPANDATDMAALLRRQGFDVTLLTNANKAKMVDAVREFGMKLRQGGVGLFFFAGHGLQIRGENYLVPVGARVEAEAEAEFECLEANRVLRMMEDAKNDLNIVILDACRNNPFARSFRSADRGLAQMNAPTGSLVAFATAPGSVAADGEGRNGLYTGYLLRHMAEPGVPVLQMLMRVRNDVLKASGRKQTPWESSSLTGDFFFAGQQAASAAPVVASAPPPAPVARPAKAALDLSDIDQAAVARTKNEAASRKEWAGRLKAMQGDFGKVQAMEQSPKYSAEDRARAWDKYLAAYQDKNPFGDEDKILREKATARQGYWAGEVQRQVQAQAEARASQERATMAGTYSGTVKRSKVGGSVIASRIYTLRMNSDLRTGTIDVRELNGSFVAALDIAGSVSGRNFVGKTVVRQATISYKPDDIRITFSADLRSVEWSHGDGNIQGSGILERKSAP